MNRCRTCKHWNNSEETTSWNKQHARHLLYPYKNYGECLNREMKASIFQDISVFGNYTHNNFGCVFFKKK